MIFVQIASYRDPETLPTILDCLKNARYPNDLRFGVCWQRHEEDHSLTSLKKDKRFRIEDIPWYNSLGLCWARSRVQSLYDGEDFTLQIDSHHRFAEDWDCKLMELMELTGSAKPILTSYASAYEAISNEKICNEPYQMIAHKFTSSGTIMFVPKIIPHWKDLTRPIRSRFVSGHFFFTLGSHCVEYRYDPDIYFAGDEISLSLRSFTMGYDLFHPHKVILWHDYTRNGRVKHWDDHVPKNSTRVAMTWYERDQISKKRIRKLLQEEDNDEMLGQYGLGTMRSHGEYELYAGIDFKNRRLHKDAREGVEPPSNYVSPELWEKSFTSQYTITLKWNREEISQHQDLKFVFFGVEDDMGNLIYRYDATPLSPELKGTVNQKNIEFFSEYVPTKFILWPVSHSKGWLKKSVYMLH